MQRRRQSPTSPMPRPRHLLQPRPRQRQQLRSLHQLRRRNNVPMETWTNALSSFQRAFHFSGSTSFEVATFQIPCKPKKSCFGTLIFLALGLTLVLFTTDCARSEKRADIVILNGG